MMKLFRNKITNYLYLIGYICDWGTLICNVRVLSWCFYPVSHFISFSAFLLYPPHHPFLLHSLSVIRSIGGNLALARTRSASPVEFAVSLLRICRFSLDSLSSWVWEEYREPTHTHIWSYPWGFNARQIYMYINMCICIGIIRDGRHHGLGTHTIYQTMREIVVDESEVVGRSVKVHWYMYICILYM